MFSYFIFEWCIFVHLFRCLLLLLTFCDSQREFLAGNFPLLPDREAHTLPICKSWLHSLGLVITVCINYQTSLGFHGAFLSENKSENQELCGLHIASCVLVEKFDRIFLNSFTEKKQKNMDCISSKKMTVDMIMAWISPAFASLGHEYIQIQFHSAIWLSWGCLLSCLFMTERWCHFSDGVIVIQLYVSPVYDSCHDG